MKAIDRVELPHELAIAFPQKKISAASVANGEPYHVDSLEQLMRVVAGVSAYNPSYTVLFRGQNNDYRAQTSRRGSLILPGIYRGITKIDADVDELGKRFDRLRRASELIAREVNGHMAKTPDDKRRGFVARRIQQWAMIQHYEICDTPLLDLTRSLRVACWFALDGAKAGDSPVLYVFGMPYMHDRIALDSNAELFQMNLTSLLPPTASRPAFQEGVLVGYEQPDSRVDAIGESNFSRRLLAKIALPRDSGFRRSLGLDKELIYPSDDPFLTRSNRVRAQLDGNYVQPVIDNLRESIQRSSDAMAKAYSDAVRSLELNLDESKRYW